MAESKYLDREKLLGVKHHHGRFLLFALLLGVLIPDLLFLNYQLFVKDGGKQVTREDEAKSQEISSQNLKQEYVCDKECQEQIDSLVAASVARQAGGVKIESEEISSVKEYYVPLGAGSIRSTIWQNVAGLEAEIDGSAYGDIKKVTFEVTVSVPTGNQTVELQLFNSSANHPVWFSNVTFEGGSGAKLLTSNPITLDSGKNKYIVKAKTQLDFTANIDQARVHIVSK